MQKKLKVAVIGFGGIGHHHVAQYADQPECRLVAVVDISRKALSTLSSSINIGDSGQADLAGVHKYTSYQRMLKKERPDMVDICLPTDLHEPMAIQAMRDGCHVLSEKPMARTAEAARRMIAVARETGRHLMVAQCIRFFPVYRGLAKIHRSGKYGKLLRLVAERLSGFPESPWYRDYSRSGGALLDLHLHDTDFLHVLLGMPREVATSGVHRADAAGVNESITRYFFEGSDAQVWAEQSWLRSGFRAGLTAVYEKATIRLEGDSLSIFRPGRKEPKVLDFSAEKNGYWQEIAYFAHCVLKDRPVDECLPREYPGFPADLPGGGEVRQLPGGAGRLLGEPLPPPPACRFSGTCGSVLH